MLLNSTSGAALSTIQAYTEDLNMEGFVQAIEELYYKYGRPTQFRDALIRQLKEEDPIDPNKHETLQKTNALIKRILRTFTGSNSQLSQLSMTFLLESVKMTENAYSDFLHIIYHTVTTPVQSL